MRRETGDGRRETGGARRERARGEEIAQGIPNFMYFVIKVEHKRCE